VIYGFDFDGTLVRSFTGDPLPGARLAMGPFRRQGVQSFIATNQAGPVFRLVTGDPKFPTVDAVCANIGHAIGALSFRPDLVLLCCNSGRQGAEWMQAEARIASQFNQRLVSGLKAIDYEVTNGPVYRKPQPGMLLAAAEYFGVALSDLVYVGDMESDEIAARQAGARFVDAAAWLAGAALESHE